MLVEESSLGVRARPAVSEGPPAGGVGSRAIPSNVRSRGDELVKLAWGEEEGKSCFRAKVPCGSGARKHHQPYKTLNIYLFLGGEPWRAKRYSLVTDDEQGEEEIFCAPFRWLSLPALSRWLESYAQWSDFPSFLHFLGMHI